MAKVAVNTTPTLVSGEKSRKWFIVQNQSDVDVFISFEANSSIVTGGAGTNPGLKLKPDAMLSIDDIASADINGRSVNDVAIYAIHEGSGTKTLVIHEG